MDGDLVEHTSLSLIEAKVSEIWTELLGREAAAQEDATFFELSGESIAAVRMVARVEDDLGVEIEVGDIFEEDPTLSTFIRLVAERAGVTA
ncbi:MULTISPECIES: phosphopantetheine-binding protein [Streptomyces]|uniref:Carrier domain-containing protein n=2 Tax=Streptomyces TaxID=1883 RepID=A0A646KQV2_STRJU|nr:MULTISPECIES: phosphopantetheine-binding protein [Streptomyces]MQS34787.1 hypothetical protein [Streptomyces katsurahamanus]MQT04672.1 hypothetical protein [Streptomyces jumonjinensis]